MVQQFLLGLQERGLSDGTVLNIFRYLSGVVKQAVKAGAMAQDICAEVQPPRPKPKAARALSRAEQKQLERAVMGKDTAQGIEVLLALYAGLRVGEISGLRWEDIDFDNGLIHVNRTLQRINPHEKGRKTAIHIGSPKSEASERVVPMGGRLSELLLKQRDLSKGPYVISARKEFAEPRVVQYRFAQALKRAQLSPVGFHALRHSFATRCLEEQVDIVSISKLLGHSSVKLTSDTYTHSLLELRRAAVQKLDKLAA
jgi:integrase